LPEDYRDFSHIGVVRVLIGKGQNGERRLELYAETADFR
jgi:hypothetical protein